MGTVESIPADAHFLQQVPFEDIPLLLGEVERVRAILWARLAQGRPAAASSQVVASVSLELPRESEYAQGVEKLLKVAEAAKLLSLSRSTLYQLMESGQLVYVRIGRARRIPRSALAEIMKKNWKGGWAE